MKFVETLASYLPSLIVHYLTGNDPVANPPGRQSYNTVCMFADVSGFTALGEAMLRKYDVGGAEYLARHLNSYFSQMVKIIASEGGDIFKFAGDAMIVLWPDLDPVNVRARRAAQCALSIQAALHEAKLEEGVQLSVKLGIGVGKVSVLHLGGSLRRMEYVAVGEPLVQAFAAEHHAESGGEIIMSPQAWSLVKEYFEGRDLQSGGFMRVLSCTKNLKKVGIARIMKELNLETVGPEIEARLRSYVAGAIIPWINPECADQEYWGADLRNVTVLFVNLGLREHDLLAAAAYDDAMKRCHDVLLAVQMSVYQYEGSINKFLMDDKGSTLLAVFGLPPLSHEDDATRGVLAALSICSRLWDQGLSASVGVTTGVVFCGVVGATMRKEYTVLGDTVNLSARLMQYACNNGGGVVCDQQIRQSASQGLEFQDIGTITVKGKTEAIKVYSPMPSSVEWPTFHTPGGGGEVKPLRLAYEKQVDNLSAFRLLRPYHVRPPPAKDKTAFSMSSSEMGPGGAGGPSGGSSTGQHSGSSSPAGSGPAIERRVSRLMSPSGPPSPAGGVAVFQVGDTDKPVVYSHQRMSTYIERNMDLSLLSTLPLITCCKVFVSPDLALEDSLIRSIDYNTQAEMSSTVSVEGPGLQLFSHLRDAVVNAARAEGKVPAGVPHSEYLLRISSSVTLIPASDLPLSWLPAYVAETNFKIQITEGVLEVDLVKRRDQFLIETRTARVKRLLLRSKIELLALRRSSVLLIEGDFGMGKTELLVNFAQSVLPSRSTIFCATGNPFTRASPYVAWGDILTQYVIKYQATLPSCPSPTAALESILVEIGNTKLTSYGHLLNSILPVTLPMPPVTTPPMKAKTKDQVLRLLMLAVLKHMVSKYPALLIIDDCQFLNASSWEFALQVSVACCCSAAVPSASPLMLVMATRPIQSYLDVIQSKVPEGFISLSEAPFVEFVRLSRLSPLESETLMKSCLRWPGSLSTELIKLVESKAQGNPLMIKEIMITLAGKGKLVSVDSGEVAADFAATPRLSTGPARHDSRATGSRRMLKLADDFDVEKNFPFCKLVMANLGMRVDRLPPIQQMTLKVGSMIGMEWRFRILSETFPLDHFKQLLLPECLSLEKSHFLRSRMVAPPAGQGTERELAFLFTNGFLMDAVRFRMQAVHRESLKKAVQTWLENQQSDLKKIYLRKMLEDKGAATSSSTTSKAGWMTVRKQLPSSFLRFGSSWKRRFIALMGNSLYVYKEDCTVDTSAKPVQVADLTNATVACAADDEIDRPNVIKIDTKTWVKKGKSMTTQRTFWIQAVNKPELDEWMLLLQLTNERAQMQSSSALADESAAAAAAESAVLAVIPSVVAPSEFGDGSVFVASPDADRKSPGSTLRPSPLGRNNSARVRRVSYAVVDLILPSAIKSVGGDQIVITVMSASNVIPGKFHGATNPYCTVQMDKLQFTTSIVRNTLNPMWDASHDTFVFPVSNFDSAMGDVVKLSLWDSDKTGADNLLGVAIIPVFQLRPMPLSTVAHTTAPAVASPLSSTNGSSPTDEAAFAALMQAQAVLAPVTFQLRSPSVSLQSVLDPDAAPGDLYCGEVMVRAQFLLSTASMARHAAKVPIAPQLVAAKYGTDMHSPSDILRFLGRDDLMWTISDVSPADLEIGSPALTASGSANVLATISEGGKGALPPVSASPVIGRVASISRRRPSSTSISNMVEAESSTGVSSAMEKIENAVSLLKDVDSADGTAPAAQTPSQVRDLLVQALKLLRPANRRKSSSSVDSASFAQIVALTDLDDVSRRWLSAEYSREDSSPAGLTNGASMPRMVPSLALPSTPLLSPAANTGLASPSPEALAARNQLSEFTLTRLGGVSAPPPFRPAGAGTYGFGIDALKLSSDPLVTVSDRYDILSYEDEDGGLQGPFSAAQMFQWYIDGHMPPEIVLSIGPEPGSVTEPLQSCVGMLRLRWSSSLVTDVANASEPFKDVSSWRFDMFKCGFTMPEDMMPLVAYLYLGSRSFALFNVVPTALFAFIDSVRTHMSSHGNTYHNFSHAVDVMHGVFVILMSCDAANLLTPVEVFALLTAALCHDLEHPGTNNAYQVNAHTELAIRYNDISVLENHHAAVCFQLLQATFLLSNLTKEQFKEFRRVAVSTILATDMTCHFGLTEELRAMGTRCSEAIDALLSPGINPSPPPMIPGGEGQSVQPELTRADRDVILKTILHASDISNPCKPWELSKLWSDRVLNEFFLQGDKERAENLPLSPNMDRKTTNQAQLSVNFIDFIVAPLYVSMATLFPKVQVCCDIMAENRGKWLALLQRPEEDSPATVRSMKRRTTAFNEVLMPIAAAAASGDDEAGGEDAKLRGLSALHTFVQAQEEEEEDVDEDSNEVELEDVKLAHKRIIDSEFQDAGRRVEQPFHPPVRSRPSTLFEQLFVRGIMLRQRTRRRLSQSGDAPAPPPDSILRLSKVHNRIKNSINTSDGSVRKEAAHVRTGMLESAWNAGKNCLSGCMIVLARDVSVSNSHRYILICIVFAQMLSFPLSSSPALHWHTTSMKSVSVALEHLALSSAQSLSPSVLLVAFVASLVWQLLVIVGALWIGICHEMEKFPLIWPIKVYRQCFLWSRTVLLIPVVSSTVKVFNCKVVEVGGISCHKGSHIGMMAIAAVALILYLPLLFAGSACLVDRDPRSGNMDARAHGRVDAAMLCITVLLSSLFALDGMVKTTPLLVAVVATGVAAFALITAYLPFYKHEVNEAFGGAAVFFAWASMCAVLGSLGVETQDEMEVWVCLVCGPMVFQCGRVLVDLRFRSFDGKHRALKSPFTVELKARRMLREMSLKSVRTSIGSVAQETSRSPAGNESVFPRVDALFADAMDAFPGSAWLHLFIAQYVNVYRGNRHIEMLHLGAAESLSPMADVLFLLHQRRAVIRQQDDAAAVGAMSVSSRMRFEKLRIRADNLTLKARQEQVVFWDELASASPNLLKLDAIGKRFESAVKQAEKAYEELLRLNASSVTVLRRYALFLDEVWNDPGKSMKLTAQADEVDEATSKEHAEFGSSLVLFAKGSALDASREDVAVVTIGQSSSDLGVILSANVTLLKLFGYNRRDLIGKNIDILVPQPLASVHQSFMLKYIETGRMTVMNTTRTVFGRHHDGHIFPMLLNVKPLEHSFAGVIAQLTTSENFIMFNSESFLVKGATMESHRLLMVQPSAVKDNRVKLTSIIPEDQLLQLLDTAGQGSGSRKVSRRQQVKIVRSSGGGTSDGPVTHPVIFVRFQITRFSGDGYMLTDAEGANVDDLLGSRERVVVMTWSYASDETSDAEDKECADDIAAALDAPCTSAVLPIGHPAPKNVSGVCPFTAGRKSSSGSRLDSQQLRQSPLTRRLSSQDRPRSSEQHLEFAAEAAAGTRPKSKMLRAQGTAKVLPIDSGPVHKQDDNEHSVASSSASKSTTWSFHRAIQLGAKEEEPSLRNLRRVLQLVAITLIVLGCVEMFHGKTVVSTDLHSVAVLNMEGQRLALQQDLVYITVELLGAAAGLPDFNFADIAQNLSTTLSEIISTHNYLTYSDPPSYKPQSDLIFVSNVTTLRLYPNGVAAINQSLVDATAEYFSSVFITKNLGIADVTLSNPSIWSIIANKDTVFHSFLESQTLRQASIVPTSTTEFLITICALSILALQVAFVVLPTMLKINRAKFQIYTIFAEVPLSVIKQLANQARMRFEKMQVELEADQEGHSSDDRSEEEHGLDLSSMDLSKASGRKLQRSRRDAFRYCLQISVSVGIFMLYFVMTYFSAEGASNYCIQEAPALTLAQQRLAFSIMAKGSVALSIATDDPSAAISFARQAVLATQKCLEAEHKLYVGIPAGFRNALSSSPAETALMSQNGCLGSTDPIGCSAVNNGMFNNGLHQALLTYSDMMTAFATARIDSLTLPVGNGTSGPGSELLTSPEWARIPAVAAYIESGLRYAAQLRMDQLNAVGNTFDEITAILTPCFIGAVVCVVVLQYMPLLRRLNGMLKRTRGLLLLFPEEIVTGVPAVKALMNEYARDRRGGRTG